LLPVRSTGGMYVTFKTKGTDLEIVAGMENVAEVKLVEVVSTFVAFVVQMLPRTT